MFFDALRRRRRAKILATPFPKAWEECLFRNVAHYRLLDENEKARLRDDLRIFLVEKNWEGCGGLVLTDEIKVTIAALACLLVLALEHDYYAKVRSVLVYPTGYIPRTPFLGRQEGVVEPGVGRLGEAWYRGPVILSWSDARSGARHRHDGHNVVLHEFAHEHDMWNRQVDGVPPMRDDDQYRRWESVMASEFDRLGAAAEAGFPTLLDPYGATNRAEFFAVATEAFFERPRELRTLHPALFECLRDYYRQDPAAREDRAATG